MIDLIELIACIFLGIAAVPQVIKALREGHCDGISWLYIIMLECGFSLMLTYVIMVKPLFYVILQYSINIALFGILFVVVKINDARKTLR